MGKVKPYRSYFLKEFLGIYRILLIKLNTKEDAVWTLGSKSYLVC